jgi:cation:H+ antiporter
MSPLLFLILGIVGLIVSAELLIWALQIISARLKISGTFLGLTVLSIGTSFPEIGTHIIASIDILRGIEASGVAVGTNIGSNLMQITLILGLIALITKVHATEKLIKRDYAVMMFSIILLFIMCLNGGISRFEGFLLVALYIIYLRKLGKVEHFIEKVGDKKNRKQGDGTWKYGFYTILGLALLLVTANLVVSSAVQLSQIWGIEESAIGAVLIGFGTALPEFATAITALRKKLTGMSVGVLIGSNITNPLFGIGIGALISGYSVGKHLTFFDLPAWFFVSFVALFLFWRGKTNYIEKWGAVTLILLYFAYILTRLHIAGVILI